MNMSMSLKSRTILNILIRVLLLGLVIFFAMGGPLPLWCARIFPSLSPVALLAETLAQRGWFAGLFWAFPPLIFLTLACFRGRFFCRWICPAGTVFYLTSPKKLNVRILKTRLSGILFWAILLTSIIGLPVLLWLDPQAVMHRNLAWLRSPLGLAAIIPGLIFPLFILLGIFQPMIWCSQMCPTGYLFDLLRKLKNNPKRTVNKERRNFITGLCVGLPVAAAAIYLPKKQTKENLPILPPGARPPLDFGAVCHRCYACVAACPSGVLRVELKTDRPLVEWFQPEMNPDYGGCEKSCTNCSQICPTAAIQKITIEEKDRTQIGIAKVKRKACLGWNDLERCMLCKKFCPYGAIETRMSREKIPCPVVNASLCRGCGYCQNVCPATSKAIIVTGVSEQKLIQNG